jgi:ribosomal protein L31E
MAPSAAKEVTKFAQTMGTGDVRLNAKLNKHMWSVSLSTHSHQHIPTRVQVRIAGKRNDDEDAMAR